MANANNLRPFGPNDGRTDEERRLICQKGGRASGKSKRRKKMLRECFEALLDIEMEDDCDEGEKQKYTGVELMAKKAFEAALAGDWKAWQLVRDTCGQKPSEKMVMSEVDPAIIAEIERIVYENDGVHTKNER